MADQEAPSASEPVVNIVLVGKTGNGKSATGNTLLGLFDLQVSAKFLSKEIIRCLSMAKEGIHAVLFVLSAKNRISEEEQSTLNTLQRIFECKILDYFIVVFTGGDELEEEGQTLEDYLSDGCPEFLENVLRLCGGRKILLNNRIKDSEKKAEQLSQLLDLVADVGKKNGGQPYTDKMHSKIKEENDKLREQQREIESKNLAAADLAVMEEKLRIQHEQTLGVIQQAVEHALKLSAASNEREIRELTKTFQSQQSNQRQQAQRLLPSVQLECSIM